MGYTWLPGLFALLLDVEPGEVMQVLDGVGGRRWPKPVTGPAPQHLPMLAVFGRTQAGRTLVVLVRHIDQLDWQIIGARPMTHDETGQYARWEAQQ